MFLTWGGGSHFYIEYDNIFNFQAKYSFSQKYNSAKSKFNVKS